jgi:transmembrane sensor
VSTDRYKKIDEAAGDWLARRDCGDWTDDDQRRFDRWLNESPLHRVAWLRLEHVWERSERLRALGAGIPAGEIPRPGQWALSPFFGTAPQTAPATGFAGLFAMLNSRAFQAVMAAALIVAVLGTLFYFWPSGISYRTPVGGLASVSVPDGSKITLNTNSEILVAVTDEERRVELERGEAFFEVAKDPARPFVVRAGRKRVIAVGTQFSVRRDASDIQIVVTEGRVRLETEGGNPSESVGLLVAGTVAQASDTGVLLQTKQLAEAEESLSWRQGVLVFRQMTLAEASAEFNRYNTRKIVIEDPGVGALRVAGSFRANNVEAFVRLLERGYPLRAEEREDRFVLKAR